MMATILILVCTTVLKEVGGLQSGVERKSVRRLVQKDAISSPPSSNWPSLVAVLKNEDTQTLSSNKKKDKKLLEDRSPCSAHARGYFSREGGRPLILIGQDVTKCQEAATALGDLNGRRRRLIKNTSTEDVRDADVLFMSYDSATTEMSRGAAPFDDWSQTANREVRVLLNDGTLSDSMLTALRAITQYEILTYKAANNQSIARELKRIDSLARRCTGDPDDVRLDFGDDTFFLSLTYGDLIDKATPDVLREFDREVDMLEVRADLLDCIRNTALAGADSCVAPSYKSVPSTTKIFNDDDQRQSEEAIRSQLKDGIITSALLEQLLVLREQLAESGRAKNIPILFTARSRNQCGALADSAAAVYGLSALGLRAGVEWLDIEANWPALERHAFVDWVRRRYPSTRILGSQHVVDEDHNVGQRAAVRLLHDCHLGGRADALKLVLAARDDRDSIALRSAAQEADLGTTPRVAICLGDAGRLSRVLNRVMTPVTHAKLGGAAAPGQLDAKTLMALRRQLFLTKRAYHLVLPPSDDNTDQIIQDAKSLQKAHQAAFDRVGLPHTVFIVDDQERENSGLAFGGAALLQPVPFALISWDASSWARTVGFVDTIAIVDREDGRGYTVRGEHLMSSALANAVAYYLDNMHTTLSSSERHHRRAGMIFTTDVSLEPAASAFAALSALGLDPKVSDDFFCEATQQLDSNLAVLVICPGATFDNSLNLPEETLLVDLRSEDEPSSQHARILRKQDLLLEIALEQQRIWTNRRPPRADMAAAMST
mmetsp:Transcript_12667/g.18982  ORF Transcript_12667/g.18982 Transcript_12667/m.18982 type:complete len:773 (+) Transcript_12667:47-2365(+)